MGYNVQTAVDSESHLIVAHEVTNATIRPKPASSMATKARAALHEETEEAAEEGEARDEFTVVADAGYYKGEEIVECHEAGIKALVPKVGYLRQAGQRAVHALGLYLRCQAR